MSISILMARKIPTRGFVDHLGDERGRGEPQSHTHAEGYKARVRDLPFCDPLQYLLQYLMPDPPMRPTKRST
jgi:hypothetical protein